MSVEQCMHASDQRKKGSSRIWSKVKQSKVVLKWYLHVNSCIIVASTLIYLYTNVEQCNFHCALSVSACVRRKRENKGLLIFEAHLFLYKRQLNSVMWNVQKIVTARIHARTLDKYMTVIFIQIFCSEMC